MLEPSVDEFAAAHVTRSLLAGTLRGFAVADDELSSSMGVDLEMARGVGPGDSAYPFSGRALCHGSTVEPWSIALFVGVGGVIELAALIRDLHVEVAAADGAVLRLKLGPIEVEVLVAAECSGSVATAVKFWGVLAGAGRKTVPRTVGGSSWPLLRGCWSRMGPRRTCGS